MTTRVIPVVEWLHPGDFVRIWRETLNTEGEWVRESAPIHVERGHSLPSEHLSVHKQMRLVIEEVAFTSPGKPD